MSREDKEMIERLLDGWTLKTLMEPDSAITSNGGFHLENLALKAVIVKGEIFWGYTLHHHLGISSTDYFLNGPPLIYSFLYTNFSRKRFFSFLTTNLAGQDAGQRLAPITRYHSHRWVMMRDYEKIFDSAEKTGKEAVIAAIAGNDDLKCAFLGASGYWHIGDIHIPYYVYDTGKIYLQTEPFKMQPLLVSDQWIRMMNDKGDEWSTAMTGASASEQKVMVLEGPVTHAQYVVDLDGRFSDLESQMRRTWHEAVQIRIFRRRSPADTEKVVV
jgi:hypothetical protein